MKIAVLKGSGGITKLIPQLAEICTKRNKKQKIIYESNPKSLVNKLIKSI